MFQLEFTAGFWIGVVLNIIAGLILWRMFGLNGVISLVAFCVVAGLLSVFVLNHNAAWLPAFVHGFLGWPWMVISIVLVIILLGGWKS